MSEQGDSCPICKLSGDPAFRSRRQDSRMVYTIRCPRCGEYTASHEFILFSNNSEQMDAIRHLVSGLMRELNNEGKTVPEILTTTDMEALLMDPHVPEDENVEAKAEKLLRFLKVASGRYRKEVAVKVEHSLSVAYARDREEFAGLLQLLYDQGLLSYVGESQGSIESFIIHQHIDPHVKLTAQGWKLARGLQTGKQDSTQGFVAIWFDDSRDAAAEAICDAIKECGYQPMYIKPEYFSDRIMDKALAEIRKSKFVVADLTGNRTAVAFEAGFALALNKEVIFVFKKGKKGEWEEKFPENFYAKHYQYYEYESELELKQTLIDAIRARIPDSR